MEDPKHIYFKFEGYSVSGKTRKWSVKTKDDLDKLLGWVKWFGSWRCYAFYPITLIDQELVFEKTCLRDIANFCEEQTKLQRRLLEDKETCV